MDIVSKALLVAKTAHNAVQQVRKYTNEPYWHHPLEVMKLVQQHCEDKEVLAAALLHDVIEDTGLTIEFIREEFGNKVSGLVSSVSEVSSPANGNRAARKAIDAKHYASGSAESQTIKLADIICNVRSIAEHDINFAKVYLHEKQSLVTQLTKGNCFLHETATTLIDTLLREIYLK